ncbi:MAG: hypothetical protein D6772_07955, partial [Bacteroidetes bacterium]
MEYFEKNRGSLKRALDQLPQYTPPASCWLRIQAELQSPKRKEEELHTALQRLPSYTPPPKVWNELAKQLDREGSPSARRIQLRHWLSAAAALVLLLSVGIWLVRDPAPKVKLSYSQETVTQFHYDLKWEEDEMTFTQLETELRAQNDPTLN